MMSYVSVLEEVKNLADDEYRKFCTTFVSTRQQMFGVRLPSLRKIAKRIAKQEPLSFITEEKQNIYEMILLEGMVLSYMDKPLAEILPFCESFLDKVDNWAQIDSTFCNFKSVRNEAAMALDVVRTWLKSDKEFTVRAGLVILLAHYVRQENLDMIFGLSQKVNHKGHYVHMANAWLISVCMAKFPEETIIFFQENSLDNKTHNKAILKSRESLRVSKEHKLIIHELKR